MSIKEFSQKNSVALFYTTVVLLIVVLILGFNCFGKGNMRMSPSNFNGNQQGMMQDGSGYQKKTNNSSQNNNVGQIPDQVQQTQ